MGLGTKQLVEATKDVSGMLMVTGVAFVIAMTLYILIGIFAGLVAEDTISVPSAVNTTIQAFATTAGTTLTTILGVLTTIAGLVIIFVLMRAFNINLKIGGKEY
jgi:hypothetical protein